MYLRHIGTENVEPAKEQSVLGKRSSSMLMDAYEFDPEECRDIVRPPVSNKRFKQTHSTTAAEQKLIAKPEITQNSPMFWALQTEGKLDMAITKDLTKIFWLGYFLRKKMQEENILKVMATHKN